MYKAKESYSFLASLWELEEYCHLDDQRESFGSLPEMEGGFFIGETMLKEAFTFEKLLPCHKLCRASKQHRKDVINFELNLGYNIVNFLIGGNYNGWNNYNDRFTCWCILLYV